MACDRSVGKIRPSSRNLKCLTAPKASSSSLWKVEYLVPAPDNFLE